MPTQKERRAYRRAKIPKDRTALDEGRVFKGFALGYLVEQDFSALWKQQSAPLNASVPFSI